MNSALEHARALLARVRDDLYVVRRLGAEADAPGWVLGFHAQQGVEKALKAVLSEIGVEYPRTHNLVMLLELLRAAGVPASRHRIGLGCNHHESGTRRQGAGPVTRRSRALRGARAKSQAR